MFTQSNKMAVLLLLGIISALIDVTTSFKLEFHAPIKVASSKSTHFRRPRHGVNFGSAKAVLNIQTKGDGCSCREGEEPACEPKSCPQKEHVSVFTVDGGLTFHTYTGEQEFCGTKSVTAEKDDKTVRHCPDESSQTPGEDSITMPVLEWELYEGGTLSSPSLSHKKHDEKKVTVWTTAIKRAIPSSVKFGSNVLDMQDKKLMFRLATVDFEDESKRVILKSQDSGYSWFYLGTLPSETLGLRNSLERIGENEFRVHIQVTNNTILKTQSKTLGRKWDNVTEVTDYHNIPTILQSRFTTHITGGRAGPMMMSIGSKKGSEQVFNLADAHNEVLDDEHDYASEFLQKILNTTKKEHDSECHNPPFPKDPTVCGSSGQVDVVDIGHPEGDKNFTNLLVCYDKLDNDGQGAPEESIYCVRSTVNETKESNAFDAKVRKQQEREKAEREYREKLEKQQEEMRQRQRQQKREKLKKVKELRLKWNQIDAAENIAPAREYQKQDDELIVIRDLTKNVEYLEFIDDGVGLPSEAEETSEQKQEKDEE